MITKYSEVSAGNPANRLLLRVDPGISAGATSGHYLYRDVDNQGKTVGFLLRRDRGIAAAKVFFRKTLKSTAAQSGARWPRAEPPRIVAPAKRAPVLAQCHSANLQILE